MLLPTPEKPRAPAAFFERLQPRLMTRSAAALAILVITSFLVSCSGFRKDWQNALASKAPAPGSIEGPWEGTWLSHVNGHKGRLRCLVGPEKTAAGERDFRYRATWKGFLSATFPSVHQVRKTNDGFKFSGEHRMADWAGGLYHYEGSVKNGRFSATYRCELDHGVFELSRPGR